MTAAAVRRVEDAGRVYVAAAAMSLALVGLGVGIGALIWSDDSPTKAAAPTAESNAAAASAGAKSPGVGNYNEGATIHIKEGIGPSYATMHLSPGSDTNCTKDETVGDFPVRDGTETEINYARKERPRRGPLLLPGELAPMESLTTRRWGRARPVRTEGPIQRQMVRGPVPTPLDGVVLPRRLQLRPGQ
jgi:hypothetical protein